MEKKVLKLGLPKGSLQESTLALFRRGGFSIEVEERSYLPRIDDPEIEPLLLRAQEMARYVASGALDCGITGRDWVWENRAEVVKVAELPYSKQGLGQVRWVIAVPWESSITQLKDLNGKRIATELVGVTKEFLRKHRINAEIEFSWGATEVKVSAGLVDAIVELTETGRSLKAHRLREIACVCKSTTQLIANPKSFKDPWKRNKIEQLAILLKGALQARSLVGLKMNVAKKNLEKIVALLPALRNPTVSNLTKRGWYAIETVINKEMVKELIPKLKKAGAEGIIEYPLNKVIY
jgi:ATP phosphoribosyltransferase